MLDVLLFFYLAGREASEPLVPPPPPLSVLVDTDRQNEFMARWVFGTTPLFDTGAVVDAPSMASLTTEPEVLRELAAWAAATRPSQRLEFRFSRYVYDDVFGREKRAVGTLTIDGENVRAETHPAVVPADFANPARKTRHGRPFEVVADDGDVVTWNGTTVEVRPTSSSSPIRVAAPLAYQTKSLFVHAPIMWLRMLDPFQEFQAAERAKNFKVTFGSQNKPGIQVHLVLVGRSRKWHQDFSTVEVILRAGTYEPVAIRWFDPAGTKETVYVYKDISRE
jgi:hypothetical protein